jgi:selenocysteine lyase/cysteine desulfurase
MKAAVKMEFDITTARRETPGCENVLHFNNAGAALMPEPVLNALVNHLKLEAAIGGYEAHDRELAALEHVYDAAAKLINCSPGEIAVIENATRAFDMAFYSIPFKAGDRILTASAEYISNYIAYLQVAKRTGAVVEVIPNDEYGQTSVAALREMLDERVKLISICHVPTHGGLVNPAAEIGHLAREAGVLYLLDACQSVGQMPIDVEQIGCDILSTTGRKFLRGPRGIGFLYVRRELIEKLEPPFLDMRAARWVARDEYEISPDARRFENWEMYYAGKKALGVAIDYAMSWDLTITWDRIQKLAEQLRNRLSSLGFIEVTDLGKQRCGLVTFRVNGMDSTTVKKRLAGDRINVSVSVDDNSRLDLADRGIRNLVRASLHYYNTEEEIAWFCDRLAKLN